MFIEMKLEHVTPAESADVSEELAAFQGPPDTGDQKWKIFHLPLCICFPKMSILI